MFHGGFHMIRKLSLTAGILGSALLLSGCVTSPYLSGSVGTRIGNGGYVSGTIGGYPGYGYGGYDRYGYGYGGASIYGYDRYGSPIYRMPDGRLVIGGGYNRSYGYPSYGYPGNRYPGYGYRAPSYGYPGYGYPGYGHPGYRNPGGYYRPPARPYSPPPVTRPDGDSGVPSRPVSRAPGGVSSGSILRQAREHAKQPASAREPTTIEP